MTDIKKQSKYAVSAYINERGMETILSECDNNLRVLKNHLHRECKLSNKINICYHIQKFKEYLKDRLNRHYGKNAELADKFLRETFGEQENG